MARNKVLIIGGGIAGFAAGTYLRMNGYDTEIFEMHTLPGGLCTAWKRNGYTFDYCIHWLMGSGPSKNLYRLWQDLGAVQDRKFIEWDAYLTVVLKSGKRFTFYTDPERLYREMAHVSPQDELLSKSFCKSIRKLAGFDFPVDRGGGNLFSLLAGILGMARLVPTLMKWRNLAVPDLIARFRSPELKEAFEQLYDREMAAEFPVSALMMMLAYMHAKSAGYPLGGSLEFARAIERKYRSLGGAVRYAFTVEKIVVRDGRAAGIRGNGEEIAGDIVISAADGHTTLFDMLEGKYLSPELDAAYKTLRVFPSLVYVCLGIRRDLRSVPHMQAFSLDKPILLEDRATEIKNLTLRLYHFDSSTAPPGCTAGIVMLPTFNTAWWTALRRNDPSRYAAEKARVAAETVDALDKLIGDIRPHVAVVDVATPATVIRYTNNWKGSFEGFLPDRKYMMSGLGNTLPGLKNFYMVGQWVHPGGGLPPCAMDGVRIARRLCKEDGKTFRTA